MSRTILLGLVLAPVALTGCHAPVPSLNVLAPYGNSLVPPPGTGSYGSPNSYYHPAQRTASADSDPAPHPQGDESTGPDASPWHSSRMSATVVSNDQPVGTGVAAQESNSNPTSTSTSTSKTVTLAAHAEPTTTAGEPSIRIVESAPDATRPAGAGNGSGGRPVSDLTVGIPPRRFVPDENATAIIATSSASRAGSNASTPATAAGNPSGLNWRPAK